MLLHGPPGLGKTTLAGIIAQEMGVNIRITSGPAIEKAGDLAALLTNLSEGDILFVDEIHRLNRSVEEILYPAMEDYAIDIIVGKGPSANSIRLDLPRPARSRAPALRSGSLFGVFLTNLNENDILFIDEIHRMNRSVEEVLYPAMEDYAIDIIPARVVLPRPGGPWSST